MTLIEKLLEKVRFEEARKRINDATEMLNIKDVIETMENNCQEVYKLCLKAEEINKECINNAQNRKHKRAMKTFDSAKTQNYAEYLEFLRKLKEKIEDPLKDKSKFSDKDIAFLLQFLSYTYHESDTINKECQNYIKLIILMNKYQNNNTPFTDCFDEDGLIIPEKEKILSKIIHNMSKMDFRFPSTNIGDMRKVCITEKDREILTNFYANRNKKRENNVSSSNNIISSIFEPITTPECMPEEYLEIYKYVDKNGVLKKGASTKVEWSKLAKLIPESMLDELPYIKYQYDSQVVLTKLAEIKFKYGDPRAEKINELLKTEGNSDTSLFERIKSSYSENGTILIDEIMPAQKTKEKAKIFNLLVTAEPNFFKSNFIAKPNEKSMRGVIEKIDAFTSTPYSEIRATGEKIIKGDQKDLTVRKYGQNCSIAYVSVPVCKENKKALKELYGTEDDLQVHYLVSVGSLFENRSSFYEQSNAQVAKEVASISHVCSLFGKPFDKKTSAEVKDLIDNTRTQIEKEKTLLLRK